LASALQRIFAKGNFRLEKAHWSAGIAEREVLLPRRVIVLGALRLRKEPLSVEGNLESVSGLKSDFVHMFSWHQA